MPTKIGPYRDCTDAGQDLALGQMPVAHRPPAAIIGQLVGMGAKPSRNLGFDGLPLSRRCTSVRGSENFPGWVSWKTFQTVLPSAETAAMLFWTLLASGQITMPRRTVGKASPRRRAHAWHRDKRLRARIAEFMHQPWRHRSGLDPYAGLVPRMPVDQNGDLF